MKRMIYAFSLTVLVIIPQKTGAQGQPGATSQNGVEIIYQDGFHATSIQTTGAPYDPAKWQRTNVAISMNSTHTWGGTTKGYETGSTHSVSFNAGATGYYLWSPVIHLPATPNLFARIAMRYPSAENAGGGGTFTIRTAVDTNNDLSPDGSTYSATFNGAGPYGDFASGSFFSNMTHDVRYIYIDLSPYSGGGDMRIGIYLQQTNMVLISPPVYLDWFVVGTRPANDLCANAIPLVNGLNGGTNGFYNSTASGLVPSTNSSSGNNQGGSVIYVGPGTNGTGSIPKDGSYYDGYQPMSPGPFGTTGQTVENSTWYQFTTPPDATACGEPAGSPLSVRVSITNLSCASTLTNIPAQIQFRTFASGICGTSMVPPALHVTQTVPNNGSYMITGLTYNTTYYLLVDAVYANDCRFHILTETFINGVLQPDQPCVILPVELIAFDISTKGREVEIQWRTASERNNAYFTIERSVDGSTWTEIVKVSGAGTTQEERNYQVQDSQPLQGINYYRLKQTDYDGKTEILDSRSLILGYTAPVSFYPNPTEGEGTLYLGKEYTGASKIMLLDVSGRIIFERELYTESHEKEVSIHFEAVNTGFYTLLVNQSTRTTAIRVQIEK